MFALLYGKDRFRIMRRRSELKRLFRTESPDGEIVSCDIATESGLLRRYLSDASSPDLFGSRRFLDVENVFVDQGEDASTRLAEVFSRADIANIDGVCSFAGVPKAKDPLFLFLRKHAGIVEEWKPLSPPEVAAFISSEASAVSADVSFSREAIGKMTALFSGDSAKLSNLAKMLATYKGSGTVSLSDFDLFVSEAPKEIVFAALDALVSGNRGKAAAMLLEESRASGGMPKLFGLLAWQLRELIKVSGEYERGNRNSADIAAVCGMKLFTAGKLLSRISGFPLSRLRKGFDFLSSLDGEMKRGRIDPELALALFVRQF